MSDDSDWESDSEEVAQPPHVEVVANAPNDAQPAAAASSPPASAIASVSAAAAASPAAPPSMLLALPITLALKDHPALAAGIPAGITLLYDQANNVITMLAYDQHRRPMLLEPLDGSKLAAGSKLPFACSTGDSDAAAMAVASITDGQSRKWTVTFATAHDCARFVAVLAVATLVAKAAAQVPMPSLYLKHDLTKGSGKSVKPGYFVSAAVRGYIVMLSSDSSLRGSGALGRITGSTTITSFNPELHGSAAAAASAAAMGASALPLSAPAIHTTISDIQVTEEDASSPAVPASLGEVLAGGKLKTEGGARLVLLPCATPLARELLATHAEPTFAPEASFLLLHIAPISSSKKREKKKERKRSIPDVPAVAATVEEAQQQQQVEQPIVIPTLPLDPEDAPAVTMPGTVPSLPPSVPASSASAAPAAPQFPSWSRDVSASVSATLASVLALQDQLTVLPNTQSKIVKRVVGELYENLLDELGLRAVVDAQAAEAETQPASSSIDPTQLAHLSALQRHIRGLVGFFQQINSDADRKGSLGGVLNAWHASFLPAIEPLVSGSDNGLLSAPRLAALAAESSAAAASASGGASSAEVAALRAQLAQSMAATKKAEKEAQTLRDSLDKQKRAQEELQKKHNSLVMSHVAMEESLPTLALERDALAKRAQMADVFQAGLTEMRTMLEKEIEEKNRAKEGYEQLQTVQKNLKLTWLPEKVVDRCMSCSGKFSLFGVGSKGHCRFCGRVYCKNCTGSCPLPELGLGNKPVKVCKPCLGFRAAMMGDAAAAAAQQARDEEQERAATAQPPKGKGAGGGFLDDDDGDDDLGSIRPGGATTNAPSAGANPVPYKVSEVKGVDRGGVLSYDDLDEFD